MCELLLVAGNALRDGLHYAVPDIHEPCQRGFPLGDEPFGHGGGGFKAGVGNVVEDRYVALMADADDYGQRELGNVGGKIVVLERLKWRHRRV